MAMLDHWHPVLPARDLGRKPVGVRLAGRQIALFRDGNGRVGAIDDVCPHRRMRLSCGDVLGGKLRCSYHGWTFDADGQGESPGTPKLHACAAAFEAREAHGYVWLKSRGQRADFPEFDVRDYIHMCTLRHVAPAPLETTLDNFCEIEHTPTTHAIFGYELARMPEVACRCEPTDTSVRVVNSGPPKDIGPFLSFILGVRKGDHFIDDWTTYFSPVYSVYEHYWQDPKTGRESLVRWRLYMFFVPLAESETAVVTFAYAKSRWGIGPGGGVRAFRWLMRRQLSHEIDLDVAILSKLADTSPQLEGMKLSRFDRTLGLNRERIRRVYRGEGGPRLAATSAVEVG
jgi:nitrite reductase/ring-hydroxylating ferredoxin subunit